MRILLNSEYEELNNQIEEYKSSYEKILEDYYLLNEESKNIENLLNKFQSKNQKLRNKLEEKDKILNKAIEYIGNGNLGIPRKTREKFIKILKGEENE